MTDRLIDAALELTSQLDLGPLLQEFVDDAAAITGAPYGALGVLNRRGETTIFVHHGVPDAALIGRPPMGDGLFARIPADGQLVLDDVTQHPAFQGWPDAHPRIGSFLALPLRHGREVLGRIYLANKPGGFTPEDVSQVQVLARAASIAIANCRHVAMARARERWIGVSQEITTSLLEGVEEDEVLPMIAARVRQVAEADACLLVLPSVGGVWTCEIADGYRADQLLGVRFPDSGRAAATIRAGAGLVVESLAQAQLLQVPQLRSFGPALYAPMVAHGTGLGVILLLRRIGAPGFEESDLTVAEALAQQTALALELAGIRHQQDVAHLLDERQRIGRDLHDLAIQQLFAAGMQLEAARLRLAERDDRELADVLDVALVAVDASVGQIRAIVQSLRDRDQPAGLVERLRSEAVIGRTALGFEPSLVVEVDDLSVEDDPSLPGELASRISTDVADDVVAVVREGLCNAARHANASTVGVQVRACGRGTSGRVQVRIEDDGDGPDPRQTRRSGVDNLAVRAERRRGSSRLVQNPGGRGAVLEWEVPLA